MNIEYLVQLLENKSTVINNAKIQAFNLGDIETIDALEKELFSVTDTLIKLRLLQSTEKAADVANTSIQSLMIAGVESIEKNRNKTVQPIVETPVQETPQPPVSTSTVPIVEEPPVVPITPVTPIEPIVPVEIPVKPIAPTISPEETLTPATDETSLKPSVSPQKNVKRSKGSMLKSSF